MKINETTKDLMAFLNEKKSELTSRESSLLRILKEYHNKPESLLVTDDEVRFAICIEERNNF
jgi:hypothetical protein